MGCGYVVWCVVVGVGCIGGSGAVWFGFGCGVVGHVQFGSCVLWWSGVGWVVFVGCSLGMGGVGVGVFPPFLISFLASFSAVVRTRPCIPTG